MARLSRVISRNPGYSLGEISTIACHQGAIGVGLATMLSL